MGRKMSDRLIGIAFRICFILLIPGVILCLIFVTVAPIKIVINYFNPSPIIELKKSQWECSSFYKERVFTGKVWITETKCSNYSKVNQP